MKYLKLAFILFITACTAEAVVTVNISDSVGSTNSVQINPGDSFSFRLDLTTTTESSVSISYLISTSGLGNSKFSITNRDIATSQFSDTYFTLSQVTSTSDTVIPSGNDNLLNTSNDRDLGATINNPVIPLAPGNYFVSNIALLSDVTTVPGTYQIFLSGASIGDDSFNDIGLSSNIYSVVVVPEPSTYAFIMMGILLFGCASLKRKRASVFI